ncbi:DNA polymerase phi-domain-containing protein [Xylogone sp. PMI_703]|nr:DNA polymerase phi-domain-containing protein [Xylogone sp. PMI_703]
MGSKRKRSTQDNVATAPATKKHQRASDNSSTKTPTSTALIESFPFLDNPKGAELKREVHLYDLLASEDGSERLSAANAIISGLLGEDGVEESILQRHLERRLFRGLASGRKGARIGFSIVLTEILGQLFGERSLVRTKYPNLRFDKLLGILIEKTKPNGDLSGQEEKDHALGLLFGLQSFVRAKILLSDGVDWAALLEKLLHLANKKTWMREECGYVVMEAINQINQKQTEETLQTIYDAGLGLTPESVGIWLAARKRFPKMIFPAKPWGHDGNPLDQMGSLAKALKESSSSDDDGAQTKQTGNWNPKLHWVWDIVLPQYVSDRRNEFDSFWKIVVDENLFSGNASRERKFWGFLLFQKVFQNAAVYNELLSSTFSRNLVRCLINHLQEKDRFLNRSADKSLKVLLQSLEENAQIVEFVLPGLIGGNGTYHFDRVTKSKAVEKILSKVNSENVKSVISILRQPVIITEDPENEKEAESLRQLYGDYLLNIVRHINTTDSSKTSQMVAIPLLREMADFAYCEIPESNPKVTERSRTLFRNRLMSAFTHLLSDLRGFSFPCQLLRSFTPSAIAMDQEITKSKDKALAIMEKLLKKANKANPDEQAPLQALALLYSLVIFQLYNGEPEAISILDELKVCYDKLIRHENKDEDEDIEASEVLVELLLSFISKPSALLRKVAQHVFSAFMENVTAGGLKLMTDVLETSETLRGQQEMFDQEPDDIEQLTGDGEEEGDSDELDSDVEVVDIDDDAEESNENTDDENGEGGDNEDEENEESKKLEDALAKALGTRRLDQAVTDNAEEVSDSDADMTDSEMMELDQKLVEIFSQRKKQPNKKQEQKDAKETMVNFKTRILDLLDIYVKKQAANPLAFDLLLPLLKLMRTTKTRQLAEKSHGIILAFAKAAKKIEGASSSSRAEINVAEQIKLLKAIHAEAAKDPSHSFAKGASAASLLVASSLYRADKGSVKKMATVYRDSQVAWVEGEVRMQAVLFTDWVNWCQSHANNSGGK